MSGQQSIIDRIISEAEAKAAAIISKASAEAEDILDNARKENDKLCDALLSKTRLEAEDMLASRLREADLEIRRAEMSERYSAIEEAFVRAKNRLLSLSDAEYLDYMGKQIKRYAKDGDKVVISTNDEKRIDKEFIDAIARELGISLALCDERGTFSGGVILKSEFWDSNLSIDSAFSFYRDELESITLSVLLGDDNV